MTISTKIRNLRIIKGYSQENMAQMLHLSLNSYSKIERDEVKTSTERLEQIANVLGIKVIDIINFGEESQHNIYMGGGGVN
jgi:transcriptional regulator with XRE-family HTH domain